METTQFYALGLDIKPCNTARLLGMPAMEMLVGQCGSIGCSGILGTTLQTGGVTSWLFLQGLSPGTFIKIKFLLIDL